jgi:hypothetical protein
LRLKELARLHADICAYVEEDVKAAITPMTAWRRPFQGELQ